MKTKWKSGNDIRASPYIKEVASPLSDRESYIKNAVFSFNSHVDNGNVKSDDVVSEVRSIRSEEIMISKNDI